MAGVSLILRRAALLPYPSAAEEPEIDSDISFYDGLISDGNSYIKVPDLTLTRGDKIVVVYSANSIPSPQMLYGSRLGSGKDIIYLLYSATTGYVFWLKEESGENKVSSYLGEKMEIVGEIDNPNQVGSVFERVWYLNGKKIVSSQYGAIDQSITAPFFLFASNVAGSEQVDSRTFKGAIHSLEISRVDGEKVLSLLPAARSGVPGMYDMVSKTFYENEGSGLFTLI